MEPFTPAEILCPSFSGSNFNVSVSEQGNGKMVWKKYASFA
jgi:hypothetical protein